MRGLVVSALALVLASLGMSAAPCRADWQWHRIAWEGTEIASVVAVPGLAGRILVSVPDWRLPNELHGVYESYDGGATWEFLSESTNITADKITFHPTDSSTMYCGTATNIWVPDGWAWRSRDGGEHWERHDEALNRYVASPWRPGTLLAVHCAGGSVYALLSSNDDGETWAGICSGGDVAHMSDRPVFHAADSLRVVAGYTGPTLGEWGLGVSRDGGTTWDLAIAGVEVLGFDQDPANPTHWIAILLPVGSDSALVAESTDDCDTWNVWPLDETAGQITFDPFDSRIVYLSVRYGWGGSIHRSLDGGHTWELMDQGLAPQTYTRDLFLLRDHPGELLAARTDGLWLWTDRVSIQDAPPGRANALRVEEVAPCPFRDIVTVGIRCSASHDVSAGIYSLEGRLVRMLMDGGIGAGRHEVSWDGRTSEGQPASPGAYVVRVQSPTGQAAVPVVKVR